MSSSCERWWKGVKHQNSSSSVYVQQLRHSMRGACFSASGADGSMRRICSSEQIAGLDCCIFGDLGRRLVVDSASAWSKVVPMFAL